MDTVLLGEAPKQWDGFAFRYDAWTTEKIANAMGVRPFVLNRKFWLDNVFNTPQAETGRGFDEFPSQLAVEILRAKWFAFQRVVCVGARVAEAFEGALGLERGAIPENDFRCFDRTLRGAGWMLGRIPHPSALRRRQRAGAGMLPEASQRFLRRAADE